MLAADWWAIIRIAWPLEAGLGSGGPAACPSTPHSCLAPTLWDPQSTTGFHLIDTSIPRTTATGRVPAGRLEGAPGPLTGGVSTHSRAEIQVSEPSPQRGCWQPGAASRALAKVRLRGKSEHWKLSSLVILSNSPRERFGSREIWGQVCHPKVIV